MTAFIQGASAEIRVNTTTANGQEQPSVAALSGGGYVVTWTSYAQDGSGHGIYAQLYDGAGDALGAETRVNTTTFDSQVEPSVAALSGGGYVVTWTSLSQDGSGHGVYAQRYDSLGNALGAETRVNTTTSSDQQTPSAAGLSGGGYVVAWTSGSEDGSSYGVYAQRYDSAGNTLGAEIRVNSTTAMDQFYPSVAALTGGGYVVTWQSAEQDGSMWGVYAQRYDSAGNALGAETRVNTTTLSFQDQPSVAALSTGGYVVTWQSNNQDGSEYGIYAQRFDSVGNALGAEIRVNTTTADIQWQPNVAALPGGGYVVTWSSVGQDGSGGGIYTQRYDSAGNALGAETQINTTTANDQFYPSVAALSGGGYVVTWQSFEQDGSSYGVYQKLFEATKLSIAATDAAKAEGDNGSTAFTFTITRTGDSSGAVTAAWAVTGSGDYAAAGSDFAGSALPTGTVSFAAGETSKVITVNVSGDPIYEQTEGFTVTLSIPQGERRSASAPPQEPSPTTIRLRRAVAETTA